MTTPLRDWGGMRVILDEAKAIDEEQAKKPLLDCPICGNVLDRRSDGVVNCDVGHFRAWDTANGGA